MRQRLDQIMKVITRPLDWTVDRTMRTSKAAVQNPRLFLSVQKWALVRMLITLATSLGVVFAFDGDMPWWALVSWFWVMTFATIGCRTSAREASAHLQGWLDGRSSMISSMHEAGHLAMDLDDWMHSELERDSVMMARAYGFLEAPPEDHGTP